MNKTLWIIPLFTLLNVCFVSLAQRTNCVILGKDSTISHYLYVLKAVGNIDKLQLKDDGCAHFRYSSEACTLEHILICHRNDHINNFHVGDTVSLLLHCFTPLTLTEGYTYIGLGEYLFQYPNMSFFYCADIDCFTYTDTTNHILWHNYMEMNIMDSYMMSLWLNNHNDIAAEFNCYADWREFLISNLKDIKPNCLYDSIRIYYPNNTINETITCAKITKVILVCKSKGKSLVRMEVPDTCYIGFVDNFVLQDNSYH